MEQHTLVLQDMEIGQEIPSETFGPITTEMLTRWTAAADDYNLIHYDQQFALKEGLPNVIMQGPFKLSIMIRYLEQLAGRTGCIRKINCRYTAMDVPGDILTFRGHIVNKYNESNATVIECNWVVENQKNITTVDGSAVINL